MPIVDLDAILLIPQLQRFENGGRSNFWSGIKTCTRQKGAMTLHMLRDI